MADPQTWCFRNRSRRTGLVQQRPNKPLRNLGSLRAYKYTARLSPALQFKTRQHQAPRMQRTQNIKCSSAAGRSSAPPCDRSHQQCQRLPRSVCYPPPTIYASNHSRQPQQLLFADTPLWQREIRLRYPNWSTSGQPVDEVWTVLARPSRTTSAMTCCSTQHIFFVQPQRAVSHSNASFLRSCLCACQCPSSAWLFTL